MQSTSVFETQYRSAAALLSVAVVVQAVARGARATAGWLHAWLDQRRAVAAAYHDLATMSERDLFDIGFTRADMDRLAWDISDRNPNTI